MNTYQFGDGPSSSSTTGATQTTAQPTSSSSPPGATALPDGWTYKGCWIDNANGRIMVDQLPDDNKMTVESCVSKCADLGYAAAGMQYASQCFCDDFLRRGAKQAPESDCNMACSGNANEKCGAGNRDSVYSNVTGPIKAYPVPTAQTTNLNGSWEYSGCVRDNAESRALPYQIILSKNNTANNCITQCSNFGYMAGGMEYGDECYVSTLLLDP